MIHISHILKVIQSGFLAMQVASKNGVTVHFLQVQDEKPSTFFSVVTRRPAKIFTISNGSNYHPETFWKNPRRMCFYCLLPMRCTHYIYTMYIIYIIYIYMYGLSVCKVANFHIGIFHVQYPKMILEQGQPFVTCAPCQPTL